MLDGVDSRRWWTGLKSTPDLVHALGRMMWKLPARIEPPRRSSIGPRADDVPGGLRFARRCRPLDDDVVGPGALITEPSGDLPHILGRQW